MIVEAHLVDLMVVEVEVGEHIFAGVRRRLVALADEARFVHGCFHLEWVVGERDADDVFRRVGQCLRPRMQQASVEQLAADLGLCRRHRRHRRIGANLAGWNFFVTGVVVWVRVRARVVVLCARLSTPAGAAAVVVTRPSARAWAVGVASAKPVGGMVHFGLRWHRRGRVGVGAGARDVPRKIFGDGEAVERFASRVVQVDARVDRVELDLDAGAVRVLAGFEETGGDDASVRRERRYVVDVGKRDDAIDAEVRARAHHVERHRALFGRQDFAAVRLACSDAEVRSGFDAARVERTEVARAVDVRAGVQQSKVRIEVRLVDDEQVLGDRGRDVLPLVLGCLGRRVGELPLVRLDRLPLASRAVELDARQLARVLIFRQVRAVVRLVVVRQRSCLGCRVGGVDEARHRVLVVRQRARLGRRVGGVGEVRHRVLVIVLERELERHGHVRRGHVLVFHDGCMMECGCDVGLSGRVLVYLGR